MQTCSIMQLKKIILIVNPAACFRSTNNTMILTSSDTSKWESGLVLKSVRVKKGIKQ